MIKSRLLQITANFSLRALAFDEQHVPYILSGVEDMLSVDKNKKDVNPNIRVQMEDAYFAYSYSISLLHLISEKIKRKIA